MIGAYPPTLHILIFIVQTFKIMIFLQHLSPQFIMHHKYINAQVKSVFIIFNIDFIPEACQGFIFGGQNKFRGCRITSEAVPK